jgi:hypothetical protein
MKYLYFLICFFNCCLLFNCNQVDIDNKTVVAGVINANMNYSNIGTDSLWYIWGGKFDDSIDFNLDNIYDIKFHLEGYSGFGGSIHSYYLSIITLNSNAYILTDTIYPKVLSNGDTISNQIDWKSGDLLLLGSSEGCCPPTGEMYYSGNWKDQTEKFIGIKYNERFGWIKISVPDRRLIIIYDYAIQK